MRARWVVAVVCAIALTATACSGSSSKSGKSKTTTAATARASSTVWLCRPGLADNPCDSDETTTVVAADGSARVERPTPASNPPIDCFYVYPTVSDQPTPVANLNIDPEEKAIALNQVSRFSQVCKVYAPMYRQATLAAIQSATGSSASTTTTTAAGATSSTTPRLSLGAGYDDVLAAWRDYLAHDNHGRGVVLIGHSQGSAALIQLVKSEIDPNASERRLLVSAMLLGGNVTVPAGRDVGGDFQHIPACHSQTQTGCVVAYSSFSSLPPANSLFGRVGTGPRAGAQRAADLEVLCVNPASPSGGSGSLLPYFTTSRFPGLIGTVSGAVPSAPTPWVSYPDRYTASCETVNGATWLQVTPTPNPRDTRPVVQQTLGPTWGLHLVDVNIALGNLVALARSEAGAYKS